VVNTSNTLILGIGNNLLTDEGAGIHALNLLQKTYPDLPNITYIDGGTLSFTLAVYIEECTNLIVLDAAELKSPPGTVKTMVGTDMDAFLGAARRSPHEVGLLDLFDIARLTGSLPRRRALIGIQPQNIEWGMQPSRPVKRALPIAATETVRLLERWYRCEKQLTGVCKELPDYQINGGYMSWVHS
jgi:hydrogenase maturation protease